MAELSYQRTVIGYHGCDESVTQGVLLGGEKLKSSENDYDWLGKGIYFWEYGPQRAYDWAVWRSKNPSAKNPVRITNPSVLGAYIQLGNCFDLLDTQNTRLLRKMFPLYRESCLAEGVPTPENRPAPKGDAFDHVLRHLDCAVVNWCLRMLEEEGFRYHTVRCIFSEGVPAFDGSKIMEKAHIQIAVRDSAAIVGCFKPSLDFLPD